MIEQEESDLARRARPIYERVKDQLERSHLHQFIAIEPESEKYFLGETLDEAVHSARAAYSDRLVHVMRVGHKAAIQIAGYKSISRSQSNDQ